MRPVRYGRIAVLVLALLLSFTAKAQTVDYSVTTTPALDEPWTATATIAVQATSDAGIDRLDILVDWEPVYSYTWANDPRNVSVQYQLDTYGLWPGPHYLSVTAYGDSESHPYFIGKFTSGRCANVSPAGQPLFTQAAGPSPLGDAFVARWRVRAFQSGTDAVMGLSGPPATGPGGLAAIVRFSTTNVIDAFNGITNWYMAETAFPYSAQPVPPSLTPPAYDVSMEVNPRAQRYSATVLDVNGAEVFIADRYRFRSSQTEIANWSAWAGAGELESCYLGMQPWPEQQVGQPLVAGTYVIDFAIDLIGRAYLLTGPRGHLQPVFRADGSRIPDHLFRFDVEGTALQTMDRIATDSDGNIYIAGTNGRHSTPDEQLFLAKFKPTGERLWIRRLSGLASGHHYVLSALEVRGGRVVVVPRTEDFLASIQPAESSPVFWFDTNGNAMAIAQVESSKAYAAAMDRLGNTYVTVSDKILLWKNVWQPAHFLVKLDLFGRELWRRPFAYEDLFSAQRDLRGSHVAVDGNGDVYVTGEEPRAILVKFNPAGRPIWRTPLGTPGNSYVPLAMMTDGDSTIYVTGRIEQASWMFLTRFSANGERLHYLHIGFNEGNALAIFGEHLFTASMLSSDAILLRWPLDF